MDKTKTTLLYIEREEAIKSLLNVEDISIIKKIRSLLNKETAKLPAVMTIEELKAEVMEGVRQVENGQVISHSDFLAKHKL
jgi:hypothetical protein